MNSEIDKENSEFLWGDILKALEDEDYKQTIILAKKLSELDDWRGSSCLGYVFEIKDREFLIDNVEQAQECFTESASWYSKALEQGGDYQAHYGLAAYYYYGLGGDYDFKLAYEHLKHCIDHVPVAKIMMAELLFLGVGAPKNKGWAKNLLLSAATDGYPASLSSLARIEFNERKPIKAMLYYFRAYLLAVKLILKDKEHPKLAGVGKSRTFRLNTKV